MARVSARRRPALAAVVGLAALAPLVAVAGPATAAPRKGTTLQKPPELAQSGPVSFWSCPARTTEILVALNTLTLHPGDTLDLSFTVKNGGTTSCNYTAPYAGVAPGPTTTALTAGPCGSVSFTIEDSHHRNVWPGAEVVNCPALGFAQLAVGATVSGSGTWNQDRPNSTRRVAPGTYTLVVGHTHVAFPLRVDKS
jgi:hypothetical protein